MGAELYAWLKALHLVAVIAWMAGLLYLPRLFVYHCRVEPDSAAGELFKVMERRLLRIIMNPAMIATFVLGAALIFAAGQGFLAQSPWLHAKFTLALLMAGLHGMMAKYRKDFAAGRNTRSEKFYRIFNEMPTILMIAIVILAVVKPGF